MSSPGDRRRAIAVSVLAYDDVTACADDSLAALAREVAAAGERAAIAVTTLAGVAAERDELARRVEDLERLLMASAVGDQADSATHERGLTAQELADKAGWTRQTVYEHAEELNGWRLHSGPKAPWRFPPDAVERIRDGVRCCSSSQPRPQNPSIQAGKPSKPRRRNGNRAAGLPEPGSILQSRPKGSRT